jgi:hypothetical protein
MLRRLSQIIVIAIVFASCVPLEYVEPAGNSSASRTNGTRDFYHANLNDPIQIAYENGASKGMVYYKIDDPYLDIVMEGHKAENAKRGSEEWVSKKDVSLCFSFYLAAQKAIMDDNLNEANEQINKAIELMEIQPFYDLKGSLFYLSGDTATANYYWNYLK